MSGQIYFHNFVKLPNFSSLATSIQLHTAVFQLILDTLQSSLLSIKIIIFQFKVQLAHKGLNWMWFGFSTFNSGYMEICVIKEGMMTLIILPEKQISINSYKFLGNKSFRFSNWINQVNLLKCSTTGRSLYIKCQFRQ